MGSLSAWAEAVYLEMSSSGSSSGRKVSKFWVGNPRQAKRAVSALSLLVALERPPPSPSARQCVPTPLYSPWAGQTELKERVAGLRLVGVRGGRCVDGDLRLGCGSFRG